MSRTVKSIIGFMMIASLIALASAAGDEDVFQLQPEIHHVFREAEKMPPATFSKLFALITLAPWVILLGGWLQLGYTPGKVISELLSGSTINTVYISAFLASLLSLEYLFFLYWTQINLFQTLKYLGILSIATFFTGQRALSSIQAKRIANEKK